MKIIKSETKSQADALGLIRFISAIIIIIFQYNKLTGGLRTDTQQPRYSILQLAYTNGGNLVELFFIMSGFCFVLFYFVFGLAGNFNWYSKINFLVALGAIVMLGIFMYYIWDKPITSKIKQI